MSVQVIRHWTCDACGAGFAIFDASSLPGGWSHVDGRDYCERHTIVVTHRDGHIILVQIKEVSDAT